MKIAYFSATLRPGQDGVTRVVYKMIEGALARRHDVMAFGALVPDSIEQIVPMVKVPSVVLPVHRAYRIALPGYRTFSRVLQDFQPDILHINSPCPLGFAAVRYAKRFHVPVVATYHTHFPTYPRYYKLKRLERLTWILLRRLHNRVQRTFVPTGPILRELEEHGFHRLEYLPNGVDLRMFNPSNRSPLWRSRVGPSEKTILLFVSRLVWEKDLRDLAGMYNLLRERRDDFAMVLVGDGHARAELETMMPGARFLGYQAGKTLSESFASGDIFVFPSTTESFGLVTLEAMASGLVPVAAKVGGAAEIIEENRSGLFAAPHDSSDLARKVEWLLDHPDKRKEMSEQALARSQLFGWETTLHRLFELYEEVLEEYHGKRERREDVHRVAGGTI